MQNEYVLQMKNIQKEYYGNKVLKGVNLNIKAGEIHAIVGENGAGKSTFMNILFGMRIIHDTGGFEGEVIIAGEKVVAKSSEEIMQLGVGMVHQEFMLIPDFTIAENIKLNREITTPNPVSKAFRKESLEFLNKKQMNKEAKEALDLLGMNIKETTKVAILPIGHKQFIEIAREVDKKGIKLLVFDEPTAVLTESEADNLLAAMKRLAEKGIGILFITHRLDEVKAVTDNVTIIRDGEHIKTVPTSDVSVEEIAALMVGRKISITQNEDMLTHDELDKLETVLEINDFKVKMPGEEVKGISLEVKKGEILGIAGLAGHGKIGIANGIMGLHSATGEVKFKGEALDISNTKATLAKHIAFVSEDRKGVGLLLDGSIEDNIMITSMQVKHQFLTKLGLIDKAKIRSHANSMIEQLDIRCTDSKQATRRLSGGNQQKVCLARALTLEPELLFVSEPTRGIDIGAKKLVLDYLTKLASNGTTVVVTSSELAELRSICDRIAIVAEGRLEGVLLPSAEDVEFGLMMSGEYHKYKKTKGAN
ncbi:MAG: sugar ABC transporter ATP-binding protein [Clostridiales bacterium]|nr:sugar ABC transporter ATP-binding protein [Clostridiales bacterium]